MALPEIFAEWPDCLQAMLRIDRLCDEQGLSPKLLELVRLWCSILNNCPFCIKMHSTKLAALGVPAPTIDALARQRNISKLDDIEQETLDYASSLTLLNTKPLMPGPSLYAHFDRRQIVVLTYVIAQINSWNRMLIADKALCLNASASI